MGSLPFDLPASLSPSRRAGEFWSSSAHRMPRSSTGGPSSSRNGSGQSSSCSSGPPSASDQVREGHFLFVKTLTGKTIFFKLVEVRMGPLPFVQLGGLPPTTGQDPNLLAQRSTSWGIPTRLGSRGASLAGGGGLEAAGGPPAGGAGSRATSRRGRGGAPIL